MRARLVSPLLLVLGCMMALAACSAGGGPTTADGSAPATPGGPDGPGPSSTTSTTTAVGRASVVPASPTTDPPGLHRFTLYWIRDCADPEKAVDIATCRIAVGETRLTDKADAPRAALETLMLGPSDVERFNGEQTNIRNGTQFSGLDIDPDGTAVVAFNRFFETAKTRPQVAQVVFTLTQFPEIKKVQFLVDGTPNGAIGVAGMDRKDLDDLTPSVLMEAPTLNATVPASFKLHGNAVAPAGDTFAYKVLGPNDAVLVDSQVKVLASPGTRGPFLEPVDLPPETKGQVTIVTPGLKGETRIPITIA